MNKIQRNNFIVLVLAIILSLILKFSHILLPFMFGPMIAAILCESFQVRNQMAILVKPNWFDILGIQIGSTFTKTVIGDIRNDWLTIIIITVLLLV